MKPSFMFFSLLAMAITFFSLNEVTSAATSTSPSLNRMKLSSRDLDVSKTIQLLRNYGIIVDVQKNSKGQDEFTFEVDEQQTKYKCEILPANGTGGNGAHGEGNDHGHHGKHPPKYTKDRHSHHHHDYSNGNPSENHHKHHHPHPHPSKSAGSNTNSSTGLVTSKKTDGPSSTNTNSDPNNTSTGQNTLTTSTGSKSTPTTNPSGDNSTNTKQVTSTTSSSTSTTTSNGTQPTIKPIDTSNVCPQGYKGYSLGDRYFNNEANLVDLSGLTIDLNVLSFGTNNDQVGDETVSPTKDLICESTTCCVKPTCPKGYKEASEGDEMILNKSDLINLSGLTIDLDILNFGQKGQQTVSNGQRCSSKTCCFKPKQTTTTTNEDSLIDAKNIHIGLCLLSGTC